MEAEETHQRRRRRTQFSPINNSTNGVRVGRTEDPEEDLADTVVDINRLVEQKVNSDDPDSIPTTKLDVYDKETTLRYIHKLRMRDIPKAEICKRIGISEITLNKHIKELYARLREGARKLDVNELIGDSMATYNEVMAMALNHSSNKDLPIPTRLAALRTVLSARNDMHRFLSLAGVYDTLVYTAKDTTTENDIGALIKTTQKLLDRDETAEVHAVSQEQRAEVEKELQEVRLW